MLYNPEFFMSTCDACHDRVHNRPEEAKQKGWLVSRNSKPQFTEPPTEIDLDYTERFREQIDSNMHRLVLKVLFSDGYYLEIHKFCNEAPANRFKIGKASYTFKPKGKCDVTNQLVWKLSVKSESTTAQPKLRNLEGWHVIKERKSHG